MQAFNNLPTLWKVVIIVIVIIIIYILYKKYKNRYIPAQNVTLPPDTQSGNISIWNPGSYTDAIFNDLNDKATPHSATPYDNANKLSNSQVVAIYNDWNTRYKSKFDNLDLIDAISGDFTIWNQNWAYSTGSFIQRLKTLIPGKV